jgi:hypothetical protein
MCREYVQKIVKECPIANSLNGLSPGHGYGVLLCQRGRVREVVPRKNRVEDRERERRQRHEREKKRV